MNSVRLGDLRDLVQSSGFSAWWAEYARAVAAEREARQRHEELAAQAEMMTVRSDVAQRAAIERFSDAGHADDEGSRGAAEAQKLENHALELVGAYEEQRLRTSDVWIRLGGAERAVEERRDAAKRADAPRARASAEAALRAAERQHDELREQYDAEEKKRERLWAEVEAAWDASFACSLLAAEHGLSARGARREAERLFAEAEERRGRAKQLSGDAAAAGRERADAERRLSALLEQARERFGCAPGERFLYWRHQDDKRAAYAVALGAAADGAAAEPLAIYTVGRQRGVALLEPAREGLGVVADQADRRFEEYFLGPRRGARREDEGGAAPKGAAKP